MRFAFLASVACLVLSPGQALGSPAEQLRTADQASQRIQFNNQSISPMGVSIGPSHDLGIGLSVDRFDRGTLVVQCLSSAGRPTPELHVSIEGRETRLETKPADLSQGAPAVWLSGARTGRARLQAIVQRVRPGTPLVHRSLKDSPRYFAGLRFSPLILISLEDIASLKPEQADVLLATAASGADLVIAAGETKVGWDRLHRLTGIAVGEPVSAGTDLLSLLSQVTSRRPLEVKAPALSRFPVEGRALIAQSPYGLGTVRVLGVAFQHLGAGKVSDSLLAETPDSLGDVIGWLSRGTDLTTGNGTVFGWHIFLLLGLLPLGLWGLRNRGRMLLIFGPIWALAVAFVPPHLDDFTFVSGRAIVVPAGQTSLAVGIIEVRLNKGGSQVLELGPTAFSLDDVRGGSACLLAGPGQNAVVVTALPGAQYRFTFLGDAGKQARGEEKIDVLRGTPQSSAYGAIVRRRSQSFRVSLSGEVFDLDTYRLHLKGLGI